MVICHNKRCIFIHIPKTAGTSIEQFIKENGKNEIDLLGAQNGRSLHHLTGIELKKILPSYFDNYYKFSFVRNPYDRLLSEYYWTSVPNLGYKSGKTKAYFLYKVIEIVKNRKYFENIYFDHFIPQYLFVYNKNLKLLVNDIFKYEDLENNVKIIREKLQLNNNFPYLNKSKLNVEKVDWTPKQKEKIYKLYMNDFLLFGYEK
jgi:hypothetical protein